MVTPSDAYGRQKFAESVKYDTVRECSLTRSVDQCAPIVVRFYIK